MKPIKLVLIIIGLLIFCNTCSDQLNVDPTSVITVDSFWKTEGDVEGALGGMYVNLRNVADRDLFFLGGARGDVIQDGTVGANWHKYYSQNLKPSDAGPSWQSFYKLVNSANLILKYAPAVKFSSKDRKNNMLAQAYTMRAFIYFVMARTWGGLPLRTEPTEGTGNGTTQKERSPQKEVFNLIKKDLDKALQLYPDNAYSDCRCRWSKPAADALKANVYLWTGKRLQGGDSDIQIALDALDKIENTNVVLLKNYEDIFKYSNKGNKEILMAVRFKEFEGGNNYFNKMYIRGANIPSNTTPEAREIIGATGGGSNNIAQPSDYIRSLFSEDDSRKDATYYDIYTFGDEGNPTNYQLSIVLKGNGLVTGGSRRFVDDVILYRYADILLMIAEAKNALGQDPPDEINLVRKRAYGDSFENHEFIPGSKEENSEAILKERLRELAFEGKRWWDLRRFGKAIEKLPALQNKENPEHLLLWPISNGVLSLENKVKQNPGY